MSAAVTSAAGPAADMLRDLIESLPAEHQDRRGVIRAAEHLRNAEREWNARVEEAARALWIADVKALTDTRWVPDRFDELAEWAREAYIERAAIVLGRD